ncbi:hypothetical protein B0F90DRAFT_1697369 [Multifurca ochricompacta]|uniref:Uncharacterized protein n=1 Tax=Multifurca ochricompacta TaxID=376703 RepID=A0AAD4MA24_9AGAM|nr:hypothetical protein B0F90DRAFT_1697369 [Multifurca ochricompacta]
MNNDAGVDYLINWFTAHNGTFDRNALTFAPIDGLGWGAFALRDLQQGHTLFALPRDLTLSTRTSSLPSLIGHSDWKKHELHVGWAGLILCLLWEAAQNESSKWSTYLGMKCLRCTVPLPCNPKYSDNSSVLTNNLRYTYVLELRRS